MRTRDDDVTVHPEPDTMTDLGLLASVAIWGANFAVVKGALESLDPLAFNALRYVLAAGVLWALVRRLPHLRLAPGDRLPLLGVTLVGHVAYQMCFIQGIDRTLAGNASLLLATSPVWAVPLAAVLDRTRPGRTPAVGALVTVAGVFLVVFGGGGAIGVEPRTLVGDGLILLGALLWATYTVSTARLVRVYGSLRITAWTLWCGTPVLVLAGIPELARTSWRAVGIEVWGGVAYAGALAIGVGYVLWNRGIQRLGHVRTAVYQNLVPVAALIVAWIALGEVPTRPQLLGAAVILGGVSLARLGRPGARQAPGPSSLR